MSQAKSSSLRDELKNVKQEITKTERRYVGSLLLTTGGMVAGLASITVAPALSNTAFNLLCASGALMAAGAFGSFHYSSRRDDLEDMARGLIKKLKRRPTLKPPTPV